MANSRFLFFKNPPQAWILMGIPVLFIIGSLMHFVYQWSGISIIAGIFAPINESVWEHLKMAFWPVLFWWFTGYVILKQYNGVSPVQWFVSCTAAVLVSPLVIASFYYTYTGALGIESLILDILSLFLGVAAGQVLALHIYNNARPSLYCLYISLTILIFMSIAFTVFTFAPPDIPLFMS